MGRGVLLERTLSTLLTVATATVAILLLEERLRARTMPPEPQPPREIAGFAKQITETSLPLSDRDRPVQVVVFTDFECPFCKRMDSLLTAIERDYPAAMSRSIIHFPLPGHPHSREAAEALECATLQGAVGAMHEALFAKQDQLGKEPWSLYAATAGLHDLAAFEECMRKPPTSRIERGMAFAMRLRLAGTPAVVINGWLFDAAALSQVREAIESALKGGAT